jgi:hypothetical protein
MKFSGILMVSGILLTCISLGSAAKDGKVYTWKDSKGVVHYGEHPPKNVQAKLVKTRTGHSDPTPVPTNSATASSAPVPGVAAERPKDPERCKQAQDNLNLLNTVARIRTQNAEGITVYMTEDDKAAERTKMQQIIEQDCE